MVTSNYAVFQCDLTLFQVLTSGMNNNIFCVDTYFINLHDFSSHTFYQPYISWELTTELVKEN